jgi:hypothetical protein
MINDDHPLLLAWDDGHRLLLASMEGRIEDHSFGDDFVLFKIREPGRSKLLEIFARPHFPEGKFLRHASVFLSNLIHPLKR